MLLWGGGASSSFTGTSSNAFAILNYVDEETWENIATNCDIILGGNIEVISSTLSAIQLEEMARAAIAEANYKSSLDAKMGSSHVLEGANLDLSYISNSHRGFVVGNKRGKTGKKKGSKLSRELKRISIQ